MRFEGENETGRIILPECKVCEGIADKKACIFLAGVIESVFENSGVHVSVREEECRAEGKDACVFAIETERHELKHEAMERVKELLA